MCKRHVVSTLVGALALTYLTACAPSEPAPEAAAPPTSAVEATPPAAQPATTAGRMARGDVRGEIVSLPSPEAGDPMVGIRHEDIAIATEDGEPWEMGSMTMPFPVADDVDLEGVAVGDKVTFALEVAIDDGMAMAVTEVRPLAPETTLAWEADENADGQQAEEQHDGGESEHDGH